MRYRLITVLIGLLALLAIAGCGGTTETTGRPTTTLPATTTTTLSEAQIALQGMTLREKAAQVFLFSIYGTDLSESTVELLSAGTPGGIVLMGDNCSSTDQLRALATALQEAAAGPDSAFGLLIAVDQEGGLVERVKDGAPDVPSARYLGRKSTPTDAALLATETAEALLGMGVNMNLAPVADVVSDASSFLYKRTYSGDPDIVSTYVSQVVSAYQSAGLISVVKHFPGHGSATGNTHYKKVVSRDDESTFETLHLPPFVAAIDAGVEGVMMAHITAKTYDTKNPASLSSAIVQGLLRQRLGFQGVVISDDLRMTAASNGASTRAEGESQAAVAALKAGCDLLILADITAYKTAAIDAVVAAVKDGTLSEERLSNAVLRILELKSRYGILAPQPPSVTTTLAQEGAAP